MKSQKIAIKIEKISKKYYLEKPRTLKSWFNALFSPYKRFTVLKNFSLEVKKGEFIMVRGANGCGKTTLLKLIAGITLPEAGSIKTYGKVVPLIELGAGFNHELTGRENILINATVLGIDKKRLKKVMGEIIDYSGLVEFIDTPIKRYSSGMISRLAFSIAVYSEPQILLLDEIFAVGDEQFLKKSLQTLEEFKNKGVSIVLCSHFDFKLKMVDRIIQIKPVI